MYPYIFLEKLKRINPLFYIRTGGLYLRSPQRAKAIDTSVVGGSTAEYLRAKQEGHIDQFISGVPDEWIFEHDVLDPVSGRMVSKGWRSILKSVEAKGRIDKYKIKKVFRNYGELAYDHMSYEQKLAQIREPDEICLTPYMDSAATK